MIWIKRLIPIILVAAGVIGGFRYRDYHKMIEKQTAQHNALVTAKIWFAQTKFRKNPERFIAYRDSILQASGISSQEMEAYLQKYRDKPERYLEFTKWISHYIDSLCSLQQSFDNEKRPDSVQKTEE